MSSPGDLRKVQTETTTINHLLCKSRRWNRENHPAADAFILHFYRALGSQQDLIASLYVPCKMLADQGIVVPRIKINAERLDDAHRMEARCKAQGLGRKYILEFYAFESLRRKLARMLGNRVDNIDKDRMKSRFSVTVRGILEIQERMAVQRLRFIDRLVIVATPLEEGKIKSSLHDFHIEKHEFRFYSSG